MNKTELLKHIGDISQIGGIKDYTFNQGKAKGVRAIELNTGKIRFTILPDRGMDIAYADFMGETVSWISKTGITDSRFYEKDGNNFLRGFFGGLVTTCGLKNIGGAYEDKGLHDRISNTPAENVSIFSDWIGDEYVIQISGDVVQSKVFGENLVLKRTITTKLFESSFTLEDTIINNGFENEKIAVAYHCNFGYPLIREGAKIVNVPDNISEITAPIHGKKEECIDVSLEGDKPTVGIENEDTAVYLTYNKNTLPDFLIWKMLGESEYVIGLEPRTTNFGGENIAKNDKYVILKPFEEYKTYLKFDFTKK